MQIVATKDRLTADQLAYAELTDVTKAARAMLAALVEIEESLELADKYGFESELETVRAAIAQARAAGIGE